MVHRNKVKLKKRGYKRGFTIIELLITMFLFVLLSSIILGMLITGKKMWQSSVNRAGNRQDIQVISRKVETDLQDSSEDSIQSMTAPKCFSFRSAYNTNGIFETNADGTPNWQKHIIYYIKPNTKRLYRKEVSETSDQLTTAQLQAYVNAGGGIQLSDSATNLSLNHDSSDEVHSAWLFLTIENINKHGKTDQQSLTDKIIYINN